MKQCTIKQIPIEILIMIVEMLIFEDALKICCVLGIVEELVFRYHSFYPRRYYPLDSGKQCNYVCKIYDFEKRKVVNPNLAKAMLKNVKFQSLASDYDKVMFAILSQDLELFKNALNDLSFTYEARDTNRVTNPFRIACEFGQLAVVKFLVNDYGIDIDNISLFNACTGGQDDIIMYIISHPKFNLDRWITDPLMRWGNTTLIRCLLAEKRFDPSLRNNHAIIDASFRGNGETVKLLLADPRVDPSDQDNHAIIIAAGYAQFETVKLLLADPRVDPSAKNNQAIICAAYRGITEIVKLLLTDSRVNPADQNNQAIINATRRENVETFKLLLADPRVNPADQNNQAIISAAQNGRVEIVKVLQSDPRVNPADQNNKALKYAAKRGHYEIFKLLIPADHRLELEACDQGHLNQTLDLLIQRFSDDYDDYDYDDIYDGYRDYEGFDLF